jgi:two-component system phosphate regulon sensor histidine kinase PhoR
LARVVLAGESATDAAMDDSATTARLLMNALDEPALVVRRGVVLLANEQAAAVLGRGIEGRDVRLAIRHPQALEPILAGRDAEVDVTGIGELGRSWRIIVRSLQDGHALIRMIDCSATVSAEKMRVDFVANASHEIRTPLATIIGYSETLAEDAGLEPELRLEFGRTIRDEARRMQRIVEDLMSLSRIEADRFATPTESASIAEVIDAAVANVTKIADADGCKVLVDMPPDLPVIRGDFGQLVQLVENLLTNAIRYGCGPDCSTVKIGALLDSSWIRIMVADEGPGIAREHLPRVTERFYRVDAARSRESGGTGLGLAIVKHIVERHRGAFDISSEPGRGTSVAVRLPISE